MAEVERSWFRRGFLHEELSHLFSTEEDIDADFNAVDAGRAGSDLAVFSEECGRCWRAVAGIPLDRNFVDRRSLDTSLRWIYIHMIEEYARHNGHADLIRERLDGSTGD